MSSNTGHPSRRTVVRGAAWSVPAVAMATAAPAFAASPCTKTSLQQVTWSSTYTTRTQTGTTSAGGVGVNVSASYTTSGLGSGSINSSNLSPSSVALTRDSLSIVNSGPSTSLDPNGNYQTVNFVFTRPVYALNFSIDDIDRGTGYWDYVSLEATPIEIPGSTAGGQIAGAGSLDNPWRTNVATAGDNAPGQTVVVTYGDGAVGMTSLSLRFWSSISGGLLSSPTHLIRIRQMQFRTCA